MYALEVHGLSKSFSSVQVLKDIDIYVKRGEVHALLGENGAGKSTLLKALSGAQPQSSGDIIFEGNVLDIHDTPLDRMRKGIITIYQELSLLPNLTVAENIYLGKEPLTKYGLVNDKKMNNDASKLLNKLGLKIDPKVKLGNLNTANRQMIEVAKALSFDVKLIIMDEPSSSLSEREEIRLHEMVRMLKKLHVTVIYVTHRLNEIFKICDSFTVLRDGVFSGSGDIAGKKTNDIINLMIGRSISVKRFQKDKYSFHNNDDILKIKNLNTKDVKNSSVPRLKNINLNVKKGEILGVAGLVGAGRSRLMRCIYGAHKLDSGEITFDNKKIISINEKNSIDNKIAYLTEDRKHDGLFIDHSVRKNMSIAVLDKFTMSPFKIINRVKEAKFVNKYKNTLNIKMNNIKTLISSLSGGNQQKVLFARVLALEPKLLLVDEPTRGVDVGSKFEIHSMLYKISREKGVTVIVISSELPEIMAISDRIITMNNGTITGEILGEDATEKKLMKLMSDN